jgi:hypothetical protein
VLERSVQPLAEPIDEVEARESWELLQDVLEGLQEKREPMPADWLTRPRGQLSQEARAHLAEVFRAPLGNDE